MKTKVRRLSIRWKIVIPATILIIIICTVIGVNSYNRIKTGMIQLGVEEAQMAASITGFVVDGDSLTQVGTGFENTEEYQNNLIALRQIQSICGIAYLYTLHTDDNVELYYDIDTDESSGQKLPGIHLTGNTLNFQLYFPVRHMYRTTLTKQRTGA